MTECDFDFLAGKKVNKNVRLFSQEDSPTRGLKQKSIANRPCPFTNTCCFSGEIQVKRMMSICNVRQ